MKVRLFSMTLTLFFSLSAYSSDFPTVNYSGHWVGECFNGSDAYPSEMNVLQKDAYSIALPIAIWAGTFYEHKLDYLAEEKIDEQWEEDMDLHLEFKKGTRRWFWCSSPREGQICQTSSWLRWNDYSSENKVKWENNSSLSFDKLGRLIYRDSQYRMDPYSKQWIMDYQVYCRYEKK